MKADLTSEFAKLAPWVFRFRSDGHDYGGATSAVGDVQVERFFRFSPNAANILELGALEGAHTFILAERPGVKWVRALEGREVNLRNMRFVQELLRVKDAKFVQNKPRGRSLDAAWKVRCCLLLRSLMHKGEEPNECGGGQ